MSAEIVLRVFWGSIFLVSFGLFVRALLVLVRSQRDADVSRRRLEKAIAVYFRGRGPQ